jgi:hypothetical protein
VCRGIRPYEHRHDRQHGDANAGPGNDHACSDHKADSGGDGRSNACGDLDPDATSNAAAVASTIASTITNAGCNDPARTRAPMRPYRRLRSD